MQWFSTAEINRRGRAVPAILLLLSSAAMVVGCGDRSRDRVKGAGSDAPDLNQTSQEALAKISGKRIFFAHQSVGNDIINGIDIINRANPGSAVGITGVDDFGAGGAPGIVHATVGVNKKPLSKIEEFSGIIENGLGDKIDIAMLKFCYVDIDSGTAVDELFDAYRRAVERLKERFPNIRFVHATVPLKSRTGGPKGLVKTILGRNKGDLDNRSRNLYNARLFEAYRDKDLIFDIAGVESTNPDGSVRSFRLQGRDYRCLASAYTTDGGHLNEKGGVLLANEFLRILAQAD